MLLKCSADLALQFSNTGYMPLHLAAMNGNTLIFEEFEKMAPISFHHLTRQGDTVFHLTVKYKHYGAFMWLVSAFHNTDFFHRPDQCGNTLLHLAVSRGCSKVRKLRSHSHIYIYIYIFDTVIIVAKFWWTCNMIMDWMVQGTHIFWHLLTNVEQTAYAFLEQQGCRKSQCKVKEGASRGPLG